MRMCPAFCVPSRLPSKLAQCGPRAIADFVRMTGKEPWLLDPLPHIHAYHASTPPQLAASPVQGRLLNATGFVTSDTVASPWQTVCEQAAP